MGVSSIIINSSRTLFFVAVCFFSSGLYLGVSGSMVLIEWGVTSFGGSQIVFPIIFDFWGLVFASVVVFISSNVIYFAGLYMKGEVFISRFIYLVLLFVLSMNMLIFFPSMVTLLLGWDGLGIVSFILVIYYETPKSLAAGMITALTNRIGDAMILLSISWSVMQGHWNIFMMWSGSCDSYVVIVILFAGMTKSAQMPFSSWLPAAMAAPTPVSALVHSSTLVTAGVFIFIRFFPFLSSVSWFCPTLLFIGCLTMLMAGLSATTECDMKKIIALSTLSQLGVMMSSLGLGMPGLSFFHLLTHALFKALLFVCAGGMIHYYHHSQDLRTMGDTSVQMPVTVSCISIANLALCGSPFMAGFYSKDAILEGSLFESNSFLCLMIIFFSTGLTACYSIRLTISSLWCPMNSLPVSYMEDDAKCLYIPMSFLGFGAVIGGSALNWALVVPLEEAILPGYLKGLTIGVTVIGGFIGALNVGVGKFSSGLVSYSRFHFASCSMWFLSPLSSQQILGPMSSVSHNFLKLVDQSWVEGVSAQGSFSGFQVASNFVKSSQSNFVTAQLMAAFFFMVPLFFVFFL